VTKNVENELGLTVSDCSHAADRTLRQLYAFAVNELRDNTMERMIWAEAEGGWSKSVTAEDFTLKARELVADLKRTSHSITAILKALSEEAIDPEMNATNDAESYLKTLINAIPDAKGGKEQKQFYHTMVDVDGIKGLSDEQITLMVWSVNRMVVGNPE
jgi:hypothetical protein